MFYKSIFICLLVIFLIVCVVLNVDWDFLLENNLDEGIVIVLVLFDCVGF